MAAKRHSPKPKPTQPEWVAATRKDSEDDDFHVDHGSECTFCREFKLNKDPDELEPHTLEDCRESITRLVNWANGENERAESAEKEMCRVFEWADEWKRAAKRHHARANGLRDWQRRAVAVIDAAIESDGGVPDIFAAAKLLGEAKGP